MKPGYYSRFLSAERLKACYDCAPPRVHQYLRAEIDHVAGKIESGDGVLELACGYGRVLEALRIKTDRLFGIDLSLDNLLYGQSRFLTEGASLLSAMNGFRLGFRDAAFDLVFCIQNGISAVGGDPGALIREALRVTKPGGMVLFSSYAERFWNERLHWFAIQSSLGLIGEIDSGKTGNGVIVCKDGFRSSSFSPDRFRLLASELDLEAQVREVDESSVFYEILV